jgi:L,D-transpeptidase ErfK/SrfK
MYRATLRRAAAAVLAISILALPGCSLLGEPFLTKRVPPPPVEPPKPQLPPPVATHRFEIDPQRDAVVGVVQKTIVGAEDTFSDIARRFNLGYEEMVRANPGVDPWLPGEGREVVVPTQFVLPDAPRQGIVINIAAMRLFHFPPRKAGEPQVVYTHPIGIGRVGWATPQGTTKVVRKKKDPDWRPPASIRKEHAENGDPLPALVPAGPDNPLGHRAMYLGWPAYLIHGTNKPYGVGLRSSHGCIRLYNEDVEALFELVAVGTPVRVVNQPFVFGWHDDRLYLQAYDVLEDDPRDFRRAQQRLLSKSLAARGATIDWEAVSALSNAPRGIPVPISVAGASVDSVLAQAVLVENRLPDGANWDGVVDEQANLEAFERLAADSDPASTPPGTGRKTGT